MDADNTPTQEDLFLSMAEQPGGATLISVGLWADESIVIPSVQIDFVCTNKDIAEADMLYQAACVRMGRPDATSRYFHGMIRRFVFNRAAARNYFSYSAELGRICGFCRRSRIAGCSSSSQRNRSCRPS